MAGNIDLFKQAALEQGYSQQEVDSFVSTMDSEQLSGNYDPTGKTFAQMMAETGQQSTLDKMGSGDFNVPSSPTTPQVPQSTTQSIPRQSIQNVPEVSKPPVIQEKEPFNSGFSIQEMLPEDQVENMNYLGGVSPELASEMTSEITPKPEVDKTTPVVGQEQEQVKEEEQLSVAGELPNLEQETTKYEVPKDQATMIVDLAPDLQPKINQLLEQGSKLYENTPYEPYIFEGKRSNETQARYYSQGRTRPGKIITNARPGESNHNHGNAVDIYFRDKKTGESIDPDKAHEMGLYAPIGKVGKNLGLTHGGTDWGWDQPHFEL